MLIHGHWFADLDNITWSYINESEFNSRSFIEAIPELIRLYGRVYMLDDEIKNTFNPIINSISKVVYHSADDRFKIWCLKNGFAFIRDNNTYLIKNANMATTDYKSLQDIIFQLEFCEYQTKDALHELKNNTAFIALKEAAINEEKGRPLFKPDPESMLRPCHTCMKETYQIFDHEASKKRKIDVYKCLNEKLVLNYQIGKHHTT